MWPRFLTLVGVACAIGPNPSARIGAKRAQRGFCCVADWSVSDRLLVLPSRMPEEKCESGAQRPIRMGDYYRGDFERRARRAFSGRAWPGRDAEACSSSRSSSIESASLPGFGFRGSRTPVPPLPRPPRRPRRPGGRRLSGGTSSVSLSTGSSGTHPRLRPAAQRSTIPTGRCFVAPAGTTEGSCCTTW